MKKSDLEILISKGLSTRGLASEFKCSQSNIRYWLGKFDLSTDSSFFVSKENGKTCPSCKEFKSLNDFSSRSSKEHKPTSYCKKCVSKNTSKKRREAKQIFVDYLGSSCSHCGYNKSLSALEFHHTNPEEKDFSLSGKKSLSKKVKKELDKCVLLCACCHREEHDRLFNEKL